MKISEHANKLLPRRMLSSNFGPLLARFHVFQVVILLRLPIALNPFFFCWLLPMQAASFPGKYTIGQPHFQAYIPLKVGYQELARYRS